MSDKMNPIPFSNLSTWIISEFANKKSIFGIGSEKFHFINGNCKYKIFGEDLDTPIGPAAGPHTQLTQNIISAYLAGGRFFELKTVQQLDELEIAKPCIDATDEGYNVEWSQELKLDQSYDEYLKAWILLHLIKELFTPKKNTRGFIFNMSVGYTLEGIQSERMNRFIDELKDASTNELFSNYKSTLKKILDYNYKLLFDTFKLNPDSFNELLTSIENISPNVSNSVTLSTMHGCPPYEIEAIAKYLIEEKNLHTYIKLNPTLLGYDFVNNTLHQLGYNYINLSRSSFEHDLQYKDAIPMLKRLIGFANEHNCVFGVKLSNTLGVKNTLLALPGDDMYMSGRSLFPLTINLAYKLAEEFNGNLNISYSGGANIYNTLEILKGGIKPITYATELLKPGGYVRLKQISENIEPHLTAINEEEIINLSFLKSLAENSLTDKNYFKEKREIKSIKIQKSLPSFDCYIAPCQEACPIHQDVASYIKLVEQKRYEEAYELIISKNPLPHITGYICDHQCMYHCTRWDYDNPVLIRDIKKEAALKGYDSYIKNFTTAFSFVENKTKVAVIGAGPSGLSAAYFLAKAGFDVTIFEKEMNAGGIVENILPQFRLPKEAIEKDIQFIEKHGIRFVFGFDPDFPIGKLKKEGYHYIYVAIGAGLSNKLQLEGNHENIFDAIKLLKDFHNLKLLGIGKNVAVIGGGNSAMDSARAAIRYEGVEKVFLIYRRTKSEMPADKEEFYAALNDGVEFKELLLPIKFQNGILICQKMKLDKTGSDGRISVIPVVNEFEEFKIDSVISAIGEHVDKDYMHRNKIRMAHNSAVVNDINETDVSNVFIGGDALRGPSTVVESIADGKKAAEAIIKREHIKNSLELPINYFVDDSKLFEDIHQRKGNIAEVNLDNLELETSRCLGCNFICNKCVEVCPNRANVAIQTEVGLLNDKFQILHLDSLCNECGNCETFCPYQGAPYKIKPTLFSNEQDFNNSKNNGFYVTEYNNQKTIHFRWKYEKGFFTYNENGEVIKESYFEQKDIEILKEWIKNICMNYSYLSTICES